MPFRTFQFFIPVNLYLDEAWLRFESEVIRYIRHVDTPTLFLLISPFYSRHESNDAQDSDSASIYTRTGQL